ncbi:Pantothenate kinase type III, CoaX-like [hydrothermal vent metagenome]|uniref:Type III pantothenate kinase n=1 Tax=hydrothermal vent metagenome TaxID=652676 RepID=A0A3B0Z885_9ZZZZ
MILLLDIGNTRIKWGGLVGGEFLPGSALQRGDGDVTSMISAVEGKQYCPSHVVVSNVAQDEYHARLVSEVGRRWGCEVEFVATQATAFGVVNGYDEPQRLGVDRWLALIAARQVVDGALCVIDCGTALTVDLLTQEGVHLGGIIVPGVTLMREALVNNTEGLDVTSEWQAEDGGLLMARNTADAIAGGAHYSLVALIDRAVLDARTLLDNDLSVVLTGGDANTLKTHLKCDSLFEPDLVLKGLAVVAKVVKQ